MHNDAGWLCSFAHLWGVLLDVQWMMMFDLSLLLTVYLVASYSFQLSRKDRWELSLNWPSIVRITSFICERKTTYLRLPENCRQSHTAESWKSTSSAKLVLFISRPTILPSLQSWRHNITSSCKFFATFGFESWKGLLDSCIAIEGELQWVPLKKTCMPR